MAKSEKLAPHPRLFAGRDELQRLKKKPRLEFLKGCARQVARRAEQYGA